MSWKIYLWCKQNIIWDNLLSKHYYKILLLYQRPNFIVKLTPYLCKPSNKRVLEPVQRTPAQSGIWNNILRANAVPITVIFPTKNKKKTIIRESYFSYLTFNILILDHPIASISVLTLYYLQGCQLQWLQLPPAPIGSISHTWGTQPCRPLLDVSLDDETQIC